MANTTSYQSAGWLNLELFLPLLNGAYSTVLKSVPLTVTLAGDPSSLSSRLDQTI